MKDVDDFEVLQLLAAIEYRWGYDFTGYARSSIKRRIRNTMIRHSIKHISELIPKVLHDQRFFQDMVKDFSITVTEMFRNPSVWKALQTEVFPILRTWPYFKIWHAACATGEEAYSMAILLDEAGLLDRATIYATDFNDIALQKAKDGIYQKKEMHKAEIHYRAAGGVGSLNDYYYEDGDVVRMKKKLRDHIVWANHNLTVDRVFGEMNLILCRNVLIYFTQPLQNRVLELFSASLTQNGFLCLGDKETLDFSSVSSLYKPVEAKKRIYRYINVDSIQLIVT
jgi:chemotaxis protein methyltransferase CheR